MTTTPAPSLTTFALTGSTVGPFATGWTYAEAADVRASLGLTTGAEAPLTLTTDFTVTGATPLTTGGTVTLSVALVPLGGWPEGARLILRRRTARRQATAFPDTEGHKPRATEAGFDKAMRIAQEDRDDLDRAVLAPAGEGGLILPMAAARAGRFLTFDADGRPVASVRPEDFTALDKASVRLDNLTAGALEALLVAASGGNTARPLATLLGLYASPEKYGAVSGTISAAQALVNTVRLRTALNSGEIIDGGGRTYCINGELRPSGGFRGLRNLKLRQLSTDVTLEKNFLIDGLSDFDIDGLEVDVNGLLQTPGFSAASGIQISNCTRFSTTRLKVRRGGAISGIIFAFCSDFTSTDDGARDFVTAVYATQPPDDLIQGVWFAECSRFVATRPYGINLLANWVGRPAVFRQWSRGIAMAGCRDGEVVAPRASDVDQGIDVTGGAGNRRILILAPVISDVGSWGVKFANHNYDCQVIGGTVNRAGAAGYVVSTVDNTGDPQVQRIAFIGCQVFDPGFNGLHSTGAGFRVIRHSSAGAGRPSGVKFQGCRAIDTQAVKTMSRGFWQYVDDPTNGVLPWVNTPGVEQNEVDESCSSVGHTLASRDGFATSDRFSTSWALTGVGNLSPDMPNGTWTDIPFATEVRDLADLHSAGQPAFVTVKVSGLYLVRARVTFANNATGWRGARFLVNGAEFGRIRRPSAGASDNTELVINELVWINVGEVVRVQGAHAAGAALAVPLSDCTFTGTLISRNPY